MLLAGSGSDAEGAVTYAWTQVSGPAVTLSSSTAPTPTFTAPLIDTATATIELRLTVTDSANATATDTVTVTVNNVSAGNTPPTASAGPDQIVEEGASGQLSGSGTDAEGAVTFAWTHVSGPTMALSSPTVARPTYTAPQITTATATAVMQLAVTDTAGTTTTDSVTITIRDSFTPVGCH